MTHDSTKEMLNKAEDYLNNRLNRVETQGANMEDEEEQIEAEVVEEEL